MTCNLANEDKDKNLLFEIEEPFSRRYELGLADSGTPESAKRRARFYNLVNLLRQTDGLAGEVAECGCWKGLSAFLMCNSLRDVDPAFRGKTFHIFDSFEGLSEPGRVDVIERSILLDGRERKGKPLKKAGAYSATMDEVRQFLKDFPELTFNKGWLPQSLAALPDRQYRFVHIDLDLYDPIKGAAEYFLARLTNGGIMVCDDYGSLFWPGAKRAFDEAAMQYNLRVLSLSSGQGILFNR